MTFIVYRHQVVVVLIHLNRRQLSLVNNVLVAQRAEVEPIVEADGVSGTLSEDVELPFEVLLVERGRLGWARLDAITVGGLENDEGLEDQGFSRQRGRT